MTLPRHRPEISRAEDRAPPLWRRPESILILMAFGSMLAFSTWMEVAAIFIIDVVYFDGSDNGWMMIFAAPLIGRMIARRGERLALIVEYSGLLTVFLVYAGLYWFGGPWEVAAVAFTIKHIVAAFLPALLGYFWLVDPAFPYSLAAAMACVSHFLATLVPHRPEKGRETRSMRGTLAQPAA